MKLTRNLCLGMLALVPGAVSASQEALTEARATTNEWIAVEQSISQEALAWEEQQILLRDLIEIQKARVEKLENAIAEAEAVVSTADQTRRDLLAKSDALDTSAERVEVFVRETESQLRELRPRLPEPLQAEVAPLYQRLPDEETDVAGLGERMQTVISLLTKIRQFDGRITVSERIGKVPGSGEEASIRTLWLGLGQAYYLAPGDAGFGTPGVSGWEWHSRPELAANIREAIELAEGQAAAPKWIDLPVQLQEETSK